MARISKKNERFRTKDQICNDLAKMLRADLCYGTKWAVVAEVIWVWSEFDGKYKGCPYWSESAIKLEEDLRKTHTAMSAVYPKRFVHEHIAPRTLITKRLFSMDEPTAERIKEFLDAFCIGVVVTKDEDGKLNELGLRSSMPKDWDGKDPWARYRTAGITGPNIPIYGG